MDYIHSTLYSYGPKLSWDTIPVKIFSACIFTVIEFLLQNVVPKMCNITYTRQKPNMYRLQEYMLGCDNCVITSCDEFFIGSYIHTYTCTSTAWVNSYC